MKKRASQKIKGNILEKKPDCTFKWNDRRKERMKEVEGGSLSLSLISARSNGEHTSAAALTGTLLGQSASSWSTVSSAWDWGRVLSLSFSLTLSLSLWCGEQRRALCVCERVAERWWNVRVSEPLGSFSLPEDVRGLEAERGIHSILQAEPSAQACFPSLSLSIHSFLWGFSHPFFPSCSSSVEQGDRHPPIDSFLWWWLPPSLPPPPPPPLSPSPPPPPPLFFFYSSRGPLWSSKPPCMTICTCMDLKTRRRWVIFLAIGIGYGYI